MPEMLSPGAALVGAGLGAFVPLITDGRFSGRRRSDDGPWRTLLCASWECSQPFYRFFFPLNFILIFSSCVFLWCTTN